MERDNDGERDGERWRETMMEREMERDNDGERDGERQ